MNKVGIWRCCRIILFDMRGSGEYRGHGGRILAVIIDRVEIGLRGGCGERVPSFVGTFYALPFICDWSLQSRIVRPLSHGALLGVASCGWHARIAKKLRRFVSFQTGEIRYNCN